MRTTTVKGDSGSFLPMSANAYQNGSENIVDCSFDTSSVTSMWEMFGHCPKLTSIDVSGFDTSKVTDMSGVFNGCPRLTSLDVSGFNNTDDSMKYIFTCTGTNNNATDITIRKVGMKKALYNCETNQRNYFLFAIIDLEEPIIVPAGQGYSITVDMTEQ